MIFKGSRRLGGVRRKKEAEKMGGGTPEIKLHESKTDL